MAFLKEVEESNFDEQVARSEGLVLVDFWATWCMPCRQLGNTLQSVSSQMGDRVQIVKLNIETSPSIASRFRVVNIPFMILFKNGEVIDQLMGNQSKHKIVSMLEQHL